MVSLSKRFKKVKKVAKKSYQIAKGTGVSGAKRTIKGVVNKKNAKKLGKKALKVTLKGTKRGARWSDRHRQEIGDYGGGAIALGGLAAGAATKNPGVAAAGLTAAGAWKSYVPDMLHDSDKEINHGRELQSTRNTSSHNVAARPTGAQA